MCHHTIERLPCQPASVRAARTFVAATLDAWGATTDDIAYHRVADAVLVASELISNAVKFCANEVVLQVSAHRDRIEIDVTDDNPRPAQLQRPDPLTPGGRGLLIVRAIADQWGQHQHEDDKTVWAHLRLPPGSALGRDCTLDT